MNLTESVLQNTGQQWNKEEQWYEMDKPSQPIVVFYLETNHFTGFFMKFITGVKWVKLKGYGSSRAEVFCKKGVLKNFAKFTGKHLRWSLFIIKFLTLFKTLWRRSFPVNFAKFLKIPFSLLWLLLRLLARESNTKNNMKQTYIS